MKTRKGMKILVSKNHSKVLGLLYETVIYKLDGTQLLLNAGEYKTKHTKTCINDLLELFDYKLNQVKGEWVIKQPNGEHLPFVNGMTMTIERGNK